MTEQRQVSGFLVLDFLPPPPTQAGTSGQGSKARGTTYAANPIRLPIDAPGIRNRRKGFACVPLRLRVHNNVKQRWRRVWRRAQSVY